MNIERILESVDAVLKDVHEAADQHTFWSKWIKLIGISASEFEKQVYDGWRPQWSWILGASWELLAKRISVRERQGVPVAAERRWVEALDRLLMQKTGAADAMQKLDALEGRARFQVHLGVEAVGGATAFQRGAPMRLRLRCDGHNQSLHVYVFARHAQGSWKLLFPNALDHSLGWLLPGIELVVPEAGNGYSLLLPKEPGELVVRAFATDKSIPFPYATASFTGRGRVAGGGMLIHEAKREAIEALVRVGVDEPGRIRVAQQAIDVA